MIKLNITSTINDRESMMFQEYLKYLQCLGDIKVKKIINLADFLTKNKKTYDYYITINKEVLNILN